jgi:hypothetical protein
LFAPDKELHMADSITVPAPAVKAPLPVYPPSWVNRLQEWTGRLPVPRWMLYVGAGLGIFALEAAVKWSDGSYPQGFNLLHPLLAFSPGLYLAMMDYLDRGAGAALAGFRPALRADPGEYEALHYRLTTLPARPSLFMGLVAILCWAVYLLVAPPETFTASGLFTSPQAFIVEAGMWLLCWLALTALFYHTFHQLRWVSRIYTNHTRIDLFEVAPLYAFSWLAARTALGLSVILYAWTVAAGAPSSPERLALGGSIVLLTGITFVWPLWGVHRLLAAERARLQGEANRQMQAAIADLHGRMQRGDLGDMGALKNAMDGLMIERTMLDGISTWPWQPGTLRTVAAALVGPVAVWLILRVLERIVTF